MSKNSHFAGSARAQKVTKERQKISKKVIDKCQCICYNTIRKNKKGNKKNENLL